MLKSKILVALGLAFCFALASPAGHAQSAFPSQPIRIISPFAAGSISDITLRLLSERLTIRLKTRVLVENMPTGGGIVAARAVVNATPDGHTLALLSNATAVTEASFKTLPFNTVKDFAPIGGISEFGYLFLVNDKSPFHSFKEFLAAARAKPGKLNVGTAAPGTSPNLLALLLRKEAKVDFVIIPFRGASDLTTAALRNDIDIFINAYGAVRGNLDQKQLRAIATTTSTRFRLLKDVPTVQQEGVPNFVVSSWNGLYAPAGTPQPVIDRLAKELKATLEEPEVAQKLVDFGVDIWPSSAKELDERMKADIVRWTRVVDEAGIEKK